MARMMKPPGVGACSTNEDSLQNMWEVAPPLMMRQRAPSALTLECQVDPLEAVNANPKLLATCGALGVAEAENNE